MRKLPGIFLLPALALLVVSCSSTGTPASVGRTCIEVPDAIKQQIVSGANDMTITPIDAGAVRSESFEDATIVAMSFDYAGEVSTGVWAVTGDLTKPGMTLAIDAVAATVTVWPNEVNGEKFSITEDGAAEAIACLKAE